MKKNKIIINNKTNKLKKLIPIIAIAGMLNSGTVNCNAMSVSSLNSEDIPTLINSISLGHETLSYDATIAFSEQNSLKTFKELLTSDLNRLVLKEKTNDEVSQEINYHLKSLNNDTLNLARAYRSLKTHTIKKSGLKEDEIYDLSNSLTTKVETQSYLTKMLDMLTLVRSCASQDTLNKLFKLFKNDNLDFSFYSDEDVIDKTNLILYGFKEDIKTFIMIGTENTQVQDKTSLADKISANLNEIEYLITQSEYTEANTKYVLNLIYDTAKLLPDSFGTLAMRRAIVLQFAAQHSANTMLTSAKLSGYDLDNVLVQKMSNTKNIGLQTEK